MARLEEKVALVSGGARGIGAAIARAMADEGAKVVIGDLLDEEGEALAEEIGPSATYVHLDVTKPADWATAVATAVEKYGKLDVLVNNAGISIPGPIDEYSHADWDKIVAINLTGVFNGIQAGVPALKNAGGGSIVNISSLAGLIAVPASSGYVADEVRRARPDEGGGARPRQVRHPGQLGPSRLHPHPDDRRRAAGHERRGLGPGR